MYSKSTEVDFNYVYGWRRLGISNYRLGDFEAALDSLNKVTELTDKSCSTDFFLAMTHWQLGDHEEARHWYDQAVDHRWQYFPDDKDIRRYHIEAAELLGIPLDEETPTELESKQLTTTGAAE